MIKKTAVITVVLLVAILAWGCATHIHKIGTGAAGSNVTSAGQWYILWGLVPLNTVDSNAMAGGTANYTIKTQMTFVDVIISMFTQYVTINKRTVFVTK